MMSKETFAVLMKNSVQELLNERGLEGNVQIEKVMKKNEQVLTSLVIRSEGENVVPIIYLEDMYKKYQEGETLSSLSSVAYATLVETKIPEIDLSNLTDYNNAKEYLSICIVGVEENKQWLEDKIWEPMGDFAKVCYLDLGGRNKVQMTAFVTKSNMALFGATKEQMLTDAQKNLNNKAYVFCTMPFIDPENMEAPIYVLTNNECFLGAAMITREDVLNEIGEKLGCDYYLLPSSIHEVLIVPVDFWMEVEMLSAMVQEVNETVVDTKDKLSDKVQYYDRDRKQLRNALDQVIS